MFCDTADIVGQLIVSTQSSIINSLPSTGALRPQDMVAIIDYSATIFSVVSDPVNTCKKNFKTQNSKFLYNR
jgi:hypothetical protein